MEITKHYEEGVCLEVTIRMKRRQVAVLLNDLAYRNLVDEELPDESNLLYQEMSDVLDDLS